MMLHRVPEQVMWLGQSQMKMAKLFEIWSREDVRATMRFLWAQGRVAVAIRCQLQKICGPNYMDVVTNGV
jgi:hypothetical protein